MLTAGSLMTTNLVTTGPDTTVDEAIDLLTENRISGLPITDADGHLLGIITEFALLAITYDPEIGSHPVSEHMTTDVVSVVDTDPVSKVADMFIVHRIRRVPVEHDGKLVGQISRRDVLKMVRQSHEAITSVEPFSARAAATK